MAFAPEPYELDPPFDWPKEPFGMALRSGRLLATVVSKKTGRHVAVQLQCKRREGKRFRACELADAERVYIDVPKGDGGGAEIGCLHLAGKWAGKILPPWDADFDQPRLWSARRILDVALGRAEIEDAQAEILQGQLCLMCGRELTDPESIARNIGPECWRRASGLDAAGGKHQEPGAEQTTFAVEEIAEAMHGGATISAGATQVHSLEGYPEVASAAEQIKDVTREQLEAELKQTVLPPEAGEDTDALTAATPAVPDGLALLRAGDDPRTVLRQSFG